MAVMTARSSTLQKSAIFFFISSGIERSVAPASTDDVEHGPVPDEVTAAVGDASIIEAGNDGVASAGPRPVAQRHRVFRIHGTLDDAVGLGPLVEHADSVVVGRDENGRLAVLQVRLPAQVGFVDHIDVRAVLDTLVPFIGGDGREVPGTELE